MNLSELSDGVRATVTSCSSLELQEIGFIVGAPVMIIARASFGGPLAVRIGTSTFALRVEESEQIGVEV